ncbi:hypothetical protein GBW32_23835 [Streptomyces tsukubensis]|uniref:Putative Flp pilus-assembly TadG-like N-terminal domain-containing protein n=1 Tax=Streptomyces tsukubensis TaxID=83656 RepID=A0A1V4ADH8_9ACTN|nr:hypothetical protein B1H18_08595 [Streptomyces tsukubensis]QFR97987.1 hypothetical protein GBW32_23835 [Streptomyces tsukubensis]
MWMAGILLFVAFGFFAFAQAAVARNGAQSAADAAALAAAQASRDELVDGLGGAIGAGGDGWLGWLDGTRGVGGQVQAAAGRLAAANDSHIVGGVQAVFVDAYPGYHVQAETNYTVGESIIPGTESRQATADATAVIKPRCDVDPDADPTKSVVFACDGGEIFDLDRKDFDVADLPDASVLFAVHLAD